MATASRATSSSSSLLKSVHFEVFGKVQGVFFRKNTRKQARSHGVVGWVENTPRGTVTGVLQGDTAKVQLMQQWLSEVGSPHSKIERCLFKDEKTLWKVEYTSFEIRRQ